MLLWTVLLLQTFQFVPSCYSQVILEQPGPGPVMAPIGAQVQLNCSVMEGYRIEWGVTLPGQNLELLTDLPGVLDTLRARCIIVESPGDETSLLVINATESTNGTAATCIAVNRNNPLTREKSRQVEVFYYFITPNLMAVDNVSICLVDDITYSIQCNYITGSDARGCVYTLVSGVEEVANITGTIDRNSSEGVQIDLPNVGDFVELLIFDWESDNSIIFLSVRLNITQPEPCEGDSSSEAVTSLTTTFTVLSVTLCLVITLTTFIIVHLKRHHKKAHQVPNKSSCNSYGDSSVHENTKVKYPNFLGDVELELYKKSENNSEMRFPYTYNTEPEESHSMEEYFFPVYDMLEGKHRAHSQLDFSQNESELRPREYEDFVLSVQSVQSIQNTHYKEGSSDTVNSIRI